MFDKLKLSNICVCFKPEQLTTPKLYKILNMDRTIKDT